MTGKLRLVEVRVQPILVLDDGEHLKPVPHKVVNVQGADWPTYSSERFPRELAAWQARIDNNDAKGETDAPAERS